MAVIQPVFTIAHVMAAASQSFVTSSWTLLHASIEGPVKEIEIYNNTSRTLVLGVGNSGAEVQQKFTIFPTGNPSIPLTLSDKARLTIKSVDGSATAGTLLVNCYR